MLHRHPRNPILTRRDIPEIRPGLVDVSSVFNPGAVRCGHEIVLMLRVQNRGRETFFLVARSRDGVDFQVEDRIVSFNGIEKVPGPIYHCYDARITELEGKYYLVFAMDLDGACRLGLAVTADFDSFDFLGLISGDDNRNGVLFPEKFGGRYLRLDRPNRVPLADGPLSGNTIVLSESDDLLNWRPVRSLISGRLHYWDELIGAGPPPIKTREGWLQLYHGVATHFGSASIYQAGAMLLDLRDPARVLGRSRYNLLEPRETYELTGQVPNVVFPSGAVVDSVDADGFAAKESRVLVYYGAADTCVGLATAAVQELLDDVFA